MDLFQKLPTPPAFKTSISLKNDLLKVCLTANMQTESGYCMDNCNKDSLIISHVWFAATSQENLVWVQHSGY